MDFNRQVDKLIAVDFWQSDYPEKIQANLKYQNTDWKERLGNNK